MYKGKNTQQTSPNLSHQRVETNQTVDIYVQEQSTEGDKAGRRSSSESLGIGTPTDGMQNYV